MVADVLEKELEGELEDKLGYSKYDYRNKDTANSRNGYSSKKVKTGYGEAQINVPRDRNAEFEPQLVKKQQTSLSGDIEEKILSMYLAMMDITKKWTGRRQDWSKIYSQLEIFFADRILG